MLVIVAGYAIYRLEPVKVIPVLAAVSAVMLFQLKFEIYPAVSRAAGAAEFYSSRQREIENACIGNVRRHMEYGIRHYSNNRVPRCENEHRINRIEGSPPQIIRQP